MGEPNERVAETFRLLDAALETRGGERERLLDRALRLYQEARGLRRTYPRIEDDPTSWPSETLLSGDDRANKRP